jgi:hypothetical protein
MRATGFYDDTKESISLHQFKTASTPRTTPFTHFSSNHLCLLEA